MITNEDPRLTPDQQDDIHLGHLAHLQSLERRYGKDY